MLDETARLIGSPISHPLNVSTLPTNGRTIIIEPDETARAALAGEMDVVSVSSLRAEVTVKRWQRDGVRLTGRLRATLTQACVVTLEPVDETVDASINAIFVPDDSKLARRVDFGGSNDMIIDPDGDDAPEMFTPPELDIGGVVHEFLALAIDPYPRASDAGDEGVQVSTATDQEGTATVERPNPFAALAALKPSKDGKN